MASKKRKRTVHPVVSSPANPIRVTCPACQKEVPSFFVNSHLDLECLVQKSSARPGRPTPSPSTRSNSVCKIPSIDEQIQGGPIRIEELSSKGSLDGECSSSSLLLEFDDGKRGEDKTDRGIPTNIDSRRECASYDLDDDAGVSVEGWASEVRPEGAKILSKEYKKNEASSWLCEPGHLASISGSLSSLPPPKIVAPKGLQVVENFITVEEEEHLLQCLDSDIGNPWKLSRVNGAHQGKAYGNHIYGDSKRRVVSQVYPAMPNFVLPYVERMRKLPALQAFFPNEMNSIDYRKGDGHYLKAHMDDRQLSGKILVNLSLAGTCFMTYTRELGVKEAFRVKLSRRSLQILTGESRYNYYHGIQRNDIMDSRRVSMTFRQSVETNRSIHSNR